ncbi:MAG: alpha/beta fold hydrolase [Fidelibacterota bacterium]|nr:MAG: alpha/beta fold hydrolase [Candidatus Neomarinimicrobiota bacterium]
MIILQYTGIVLGAIVGAYVIFILFMGLLPRKPVPAQPLEKAAPAAGEATATASAARQEVSFEVNGTAISAWLFLPEERSGPAPCIVMGHGLGGTKSAGLDAYAAHFQKAGFAVLAFDFRHLGQSEGEPRQLIWIPYQQEDYAAAIAYARSRDEVDAGKIALWGTSLSGGHVIVAAARDHDVACVVSQVPLLEGDAGGMEVIKLVGLKHLLRMAFGHGVRDMVRSWFGLSAHKVPIVGKPGTIAILADAGAWDAFCQLASDDLVNEACARIIIRMDKYQPIKHADKIRCPVLLQGCELDIGVPPSIIEKAQKRLGERAEVIRYPIDHFDIYLGDHFEQAVADQVAFFRKHL